MPKKKFEQQMKQSWSDIAEKWKQYGYPAKPSSKEVNFFRSKIKDLFGHRKEKDIRALVLGATPEFRDLLSECEINTTLIDNNLNSVKAMTSLMKKKVFKEEVVIGNWLKMPFPENSFDFVLSDSAQDNVKFKDFNKFFDNIFRILKPNGYYFFSALSAENCQQINFRQYVKKYQDNPKYFKNFKNLAFEFIKLGRNKDFYDSKTKIFNFTKVEKKIKELVKKGKISPKALEDICFDIDYKQILIGKSEFKKILERNFRVLSEFKDEKDPVASIKWTAVLGVRK